MGKTKVDEDTLRIETLSPQCPSALFSCGYEYIDHWFKVHALSCHTDLEARVTVAYIGNDPIPAGFIALSMRTAPLNEFKRSFFSRFKSDNVIALHLKWIAVRSDLHRRGIGTILMGRVIADFLLITEKAGIDALTLESINEYSTAFYKTLDFMEYGEKQKRGCQQMFMPASKIISVGKAVADLQSGPTQLSAKATTV